jgi:hypothetical protein
MVVVEEARKRLGERLAVTVTGALQTPTGRMVFARQDRDRVKEPTERGKGAVDLRANGERVKPENSRGASERSKGPSDRANGKDGAKPIPTPEQPTAGSS